MSSTKKTNPGAKRYIVTKAPGESALVVEIEVGKFQFADIQKLVGGHIEPLPLPNGALLWMHDAGRHMRLPGNIVIPGNHYPLAVVGPVVITDRFRSTIQGFDEVVAERARVWVDSLQGTEQRIREALAAQRAWLRELAARNPRVVVIQPPKTD